MAWLLLALFLLDAFLLAAGAPLAPSVGRLLPGRGAAGFHRLEQRWREWTLLRRFKGAARAESDHFVVYYDPSFDAGWAPVILDSAEEARVVAERELGWSPRPGAGGKVAILVYPGYTPLDQQFGSGFRALGAYWGGVIELLSPRVWLDADPTTYEARESGARGPLVHEYTHYLLDLAIPGGNYPRWLSEGLAQYVEYKVTGYLWLEDANVIARPVRLRGAGAVYGLDDIARFGRLGNTALAYREAFLLVAYLEDQFGPGAVNGLLAGLAAGQSFDTALRAATGLTQAQLEAAWVQWLDRNLDRYS